MTNEVGEWEQEFGEIALGDKRLKDRLIKIVDALSKSPDKSIYLANGSRSEAKAVYRFLSNEKVEQAAIVEGIKQSSARKIEDSNEKVLLAIQDTTSISYGSRKNIEGMGYYCESETKGMNVHTAIAVTGEGLALGLLHQEYQTRETRADKSKSKDEKKE